jgi:ribosomal protein L40E
MAFLKKIFVLVMFTAIYGPLGLAAPGMGIIAFILFLLVIKHMSMVKAFFYSYFWPITIFHFLIMKIRGKNPGENLMGDFEKTASFVQKSAEFVTEQICNNCRQKVSPGLSKCPHCGSDNLAFLNSK